MKPTYEELGRERNELAAQVERLRGALDVLIWQAEQVDSWKQFPSRWIDDAQSVANEQPSTALAALKAQWQAEAIEQSVKLCSRKVFDGPDLYSDAVLHYASELRQLALEPGNENV